MRTLFAKFISTFACLFATHLAFAAPINDVCASAVTLTPATTCVTTTGDLFQATSAGSPSSSCGAVNDVWYKFTVPANAAAISILANMDPGNTATNANTYIELFNASTCGTIATGTSLGCSSVAAATTTQTLTPGATYYFRVFTTTGTTGNASKYGFAICVSFVPTPVNDDCSGATTLTSAATCSNTTSTLQYATVSTGVPVGCASAGFLYDVWFKFVATGAYQTVTISGLAAAITNPQVQLFDGTCAALNSLACGTSTLSASNLTIGNTYFVRVSNIGTRITGTGSFSICVYAPPVATVDYSKSYINITKGTSGGTVDPGDTLEMRFTMVVSSQTVDSLAIFDTLYNAKGIALVPGSLALRTNEGKLYKGFSDAFDADAGWYYKNGLDTIVRINFGAGATAFARGALSSTSRPRNFNSACIIMATYRVVVYAPYNTLINFKSGALTYHDPVTTLLSTINFPKSNLIVFSSPGLCPNAVSATNALGAEFNGTFGTPTGSPLARNRGTTPYTSYKYTPFDATGGPGDYYYGIANNTSSKYTTVTTFPKPDATGYRVFQQWDITGDHTGATTLQGNPACDTTKPVSATNPCGYMLVINSSYRADTAFTYTVNNLCPNTYYEISAWFKNICYKCGADSTGAGSGTAGYIPTALNDSAGVRPNIAFDVNGVDYYTTGDLLYKGTTQTGSDANNQWQKRGFVYLTAPTETSFMLTLRNNAPGGGGNDWALDDIAVTTCLPNMKYSPSLNPMICQNNIITINDTVQSYFSNYNYYKWQRSVDNGTSWSDIIGTSGSATPAWNGSAWQYITSYTVPPTSTTMANNGDKYRVVVATTASNIGNGNCQVTDGVSTISLTVNSCTALYDLNLRSFTGKLVSKQARLNWSTTGETEKTLFGIERSTDGQTFVRAGTVQGVRGSTAYAFTDSVTVSGKMHYRLVVTPADGRKQYSRVLQLSSEDAFTLSSLANPFNDKISFDLSIAKDTKVDVLLMNSSAFVVKQQSFVVGNGSNNLSLQNLEQLPAGVYILQVRSREQVVTQKLVKK